MQAMESTFLLKSKIECIACENDELKVLLEKSANDLHDYKLQVHDAAESKAHSELLEQELTDLRHEMERGLAQKANLSEIINELQLDFNKVKVENETLLEAVRPKVSVNSYVDYWFGL
jgi:hypothetical protein